MIDWQLITHNQFEELAQEYISQLVPELKWEPTRLTRDGNRDGESISNLPFGSTVKYWYEAKYSKNITQSIPKSHLDSTLVSSILDGYVLVIAFITNAYISEDYKRRADIFAKQHHSLKIIYINGDEIEAWLKKNPKIQLKYFGQIKSGDNIFYSIVKDASILCDSDESGNRYLKLNTFHSNIDYLLYISFFCVDDNEVLFLETEDDIIEFPPVYNRSFDDFQALKAHKGHNSFFIPIKFKNSNKNKIDFALKGDSNVYNFNVSNINIINSYNPELIYGSQQQIIDEVFQCIKEKTTQNLLYVIWGNAGDGKTFLLNTINANLKYQFNTLKILFTGNENIDILRCYRIILYSLYGELWSFSQDLLSENLFKPEVIQMLNEIDTNISNYDTANVLIMFFRNNPYLFLERDKMPINILVDDIYKLTNTAEELFVAFLNWICIQKESLKFFLFSRPLYNRHELITAIENNCCYNREIISITHLDFEASVQANVQNENIHKIIKKYPLPINALHLSNIIMHIHEKEACISNLEQLDIHLALNDIMKNVNATSCLGLGKQLLGEYINDKVLCFIYHIEHGIGIEALDDYFGEGVYDTLDILYSKKLIKEKGGKLFPYHDILLQAFRKQKISKYKLELESFVVQSNKNGYITDFEMLAVLLSVGKKFFWKHRKKAFSLSIMLHDEAQYYPSYLLAKQLEENNFKKYGDYEYDECKNMFILANCAKYIYSYEMANDIFNQITNIYEQTHNPILYDIFLESETEIINNNIWMLKVKKAQQKLNSLAIYFENIQKDSTRYSKEFIYALLNYYNRQMFINYMLGEGTYKDYEKAKKMAQVFHREEYIGFAKMDFAKSIYNEDLSKAHKLLKEAQEIFVKTNEHRRELDAKAEIAFTNNILQNAYDTISLQKINAEMLEFHYLQSSLRTQMKILFCKLFLERSEKIVREHLKTILAQNPSIKSGIRHQACICHLLAATYYLEKDFYNVKKYSERCLKYFSDMGESYLNIHFNNKNLTKGDEFLLSSDWDGHDISKFVLDIRFW